MLMEKWKYNGVELCTNDWNVERVLDGLGTPGFRGDNLQVPFIDGKRWKKKRYESRNLILAMWVRGKNMVELDENMDFLTMLFGKPGQHLLIRTMRSGEIREAYAEVYRPVVFLQKRPGHSKFSVEFELADPLFYATNTTTKYKNITSTEESIIINNLGTAPTNRIKITLNGPLETPRITNTNNGVWVEYQGAIANGEVVEIDIKDYSCLKGGENYIAAVKHGGDMNWLSFEAGVNEITVSSNVTGGSIEIEYYPAYF